MQNSGFTPIALNSSVHPARAPGRGPSSARLAGVAAGAVGVIVTLAIAARWLTPSTSPIAALASTVCGALAMVLACSVVEWFVHGKLMHRRSGWPLLHLAYDLHHRAHHWTHYPPTAYVQDEVSYVPLVPPRPQRACRTRGETFIAAAGQALFYASFSLPIVVLAWSFTRNAPFVATCATVGAVVVALAVHVHDAVHCPGHSPLERFRWFWALDRHHYLHHIDTRANVNFLLPLGDLLFGTLRTELTAAERSRWPSYAQARRNVRPSCRRSSESARPASGHLKPEHLGLALGPVHIVSKSAGIRHV
jgi:hypothetical protein